MSAKSPNRKLIKLFLGALSLAACAAVSMAQSPGPSISPGYTTSLSSHRHGPAVIRGRHYDGSLQSTNWSGFAVTGKNVTRAAGSWTVPAVTCAPSATPRAPALSQYSAFWVGIDGISSATVEQAGTDSDCSNGRPAYYAWFEFYPHPSFIVNNFQVLPGDRISTQVNYSTTTSLFTVTMTNERTRESFSASSMVSGAQRTSAEWIAEAPSNQMGVLPLADFGTVLFGQDNTSVASTCDATVDGTAAAAGTFGAVDAITMIGSASQVEAAPSPLTPDGSSFSVAWK
jgi:hypothetical protein